MRNFRILSKKALAFLVAIMVILSSVVVSLAIKSVNSNNDFWDGTTAANYAGGTGAKDDPYQIANGAQLKKLAEDKATEGKYYVLTNDIYLNDTSSYNWKDSAKSWSFHNVTFKGHLNGEGYVIDGLYYEGKENKVGLFSYVGNTNDDPASFEKIVFTNAWVSSTGFAAGILAAQVSAATIADQIYIDSSCTVKSTYNASNDKGAAGFFAYGSAALTIENSAFLGTVEAPAYAGAFVGNYWGENPTIKNSFSASAVLSSKWTLNPGSANNYSAGTKTETGTTNISADKMLGSVAKNNMPKLDWAIWKVNDKGGYPILPFMKATEIKKKIWSGYEASSFEGGTGTVSDPYLIADGEQLAKMMKEDKTGKYYKLVSDIYLNDTTKENWKETAKNWVWNKTTFSGIFDGDGHIIDGLYYNGNQDKMALFSYVSDATIKNLKLTNAFVKSSSYGTAILVAQALGAVTFTKVYLDETCEVESTYNETNDKGAAGFVAYGSGEITIDGGAFLGKVTAPANTGAFAGNIWTNKPKITNSLSTFNGKFSGKSALNNASADNYGAGKTTEIGVTLLSVDKMLGAAAKINMPNLAWKITWLEAEEGEYPTLNFAPFNGNKGEAWSGILAAEYAGGNGSEATPYLIETAEQLAKLVKDPATADKFYKLTADIIINDTSIENWKETAKQWYGYNSGSEMSSFYFQGTLDGDGHSISGLYYNGTNYYVGLFGGVKNATIMNIMLTDSELISSNASVGANVTALGGFLAGAVNFSRCVITDTVSLSADHASGFASWGGGAVVIDNCACYANITGKTQGGAFIADCWGVTRVVKNSIGFAVLSPKRTFTTGSGNNYGLVADNRGTIVVTRDQIKGNAAKESMPDLDWKFIWKVGDESGYPTINFEGYMGTKGEAWSGIIASKYAGGVGSKSNPYLIETPEQLAKLVKDPATAGNYYKLSADIIINDTTSEKWTKTAKSWFAYNKGSEMSGFYFQGHLDGNAHSISGLYYDGADYYVGLFGGVKNATIKNIALKNSSLTTSNTGDGAQVTALGGFIAGAVNYNSCLVDKTVTLKAPYASGFASWGSGAVTIDNCASYADITAEKQGGAFIADVWSATLTIRNSVGLTVLSPKRAIVGSNNYSTVADKYGTTVIKKEDILGAKAEKTMSALEWKHTWKVGAEGQYPTLYFKDFNGIVGQAWSGLQAIDYAGGDGTKNNPYLISTPEQMAKLVGNINDADGLYYKLTADLYINDVRKKDWEKTALNWFTSSTARLGDFRGHFDGDAHMIYGLYYDLEQTNSTVYAGLFPSIANGAVVEKLGFSKCHLKIKTTNPDQQTYLGCVAGQVFIDEQIGVPNAELLPTVTQCFGDTSVTVEGTFAGFLGGGPHAPHMNNCYFVGKVIGDRVASLFGNTWVSTTGAEVYNNYSATNDVDLLMGGRASVENSASPINYHDNYSNAGGLGNFVSQMSLLMMRGNAAKKYMTSLDFDKIWYAVPNGTPVLRIFGTSDKYSNTTTPDPIEVSFVTNGGSACESVYGNPEDPITLPTPTREGYKFAGWYVYKELDMLYPVDTFPYFDTILYAKWTAQGIIEDFEDYPDSIYDYGEDYEYYKPGVSGYDANYVKSGMAAIHRKGEASDSQDFLLNYENMLEIGRTYKLSFWVTTNKNDAKSTLSIVHEEFPDVFDNDLGVQEIKVLEGMKDGEWQLVEATFVAKTKWLAIRSTGNTSLYFDDVMILPTDEKVDIPAEKEPLNYVPIIIIAAVVLVVLILGVIIAIIIVKKKKA